MPGGVLAGLPLVDAHCHVLLAGPVDGPGFERCCTEGGGPSPPGVSAWDTGAGLAIRRWCPPVLGLEPFARPEDYLARRRELGLAEVDGRLLAAAGLSGLLVDTGLSGHDAEGRPLATMADLAAAAQAVLGEYLELAPFAKVLFSTDGYRLPELYLSGAAQFRLALGGLLDAWMADGALSPGDAERVAGMVAGGNARRVYRRLGG
jgi:hypothetical protein